MHKRVRKITSARSGGIFNFRILFQGGKRGLKAKGNVQLKADELSISHKSSVSLLFRLDISKRNSACYRVSTSHVTIFL
jgi:hypothetical protein